MYIMEFFKGSIPYIIQQNFYNSIPDATIASKQNNQWVDYLNSQ